jgi:hypothetical protein
MDANIIEDGFDERMSDYLDKLPGYDPSWNQIPLLDISRDIWDADNYYFMGIPFPTGNDIFFNAAAPPAGGNTFSTFSGDIPVPPYSILTKITHFCQQPEAGERPAAARGFKIRIYDKGGKVDMIHKQFAWSGLVSSNMSGAITGTAGPVDDPFGPYYLLEEMFVMPPGLLNIEITDLTGVQNNIIQVLLAFAVPINVASTGQMVIT